MGDLGRDLAMSLSSETLWTALLVAGPVLLVAMAVGLAISLLQVITQIQEATLSFIPKMVAIIVTLVLLGPWMMNEVVQFATRLIAGIPDYF